MTLPATLRCNVTGGSLASNLNGGAFDTASAGTDYVYGASLPANDGPILSLTDLACASGSPTTLTSATGGFTAAMIGNVINISSGTNFTAGLYKITARADTNTVTLDRTPIASGEASSGVGRVGGAWATIEPFCLYAVAGNICGVKACAAIGGTLTVTVEASDDKPCRVIGYVTTIGEEVAHADRPLIPMGANGPSTYLKFGWWWENLSFTGTGTSLIDATNYCLIKNVKAINTSTTADRYAIASRGSVIDVEVSCRLGIGISLAPSYGGIRTKLYIHDCKNGTYTASYEFPSIANSVIETCVTGLSCYSTTGGVSSENCTIVNCGKGVLVHNGLHHHFSDIIAYCTIGLYTTASTVPLVEDYNNYYDNTTDKTAGLDTAYSNGWNNNDVDPEFESTVLHLTAVTYTDATKVLTKVGAFAGITLEAGTYLRVCSGTGVTAGIYPVTRTDDDTLQLADDIGANASDVEICLVVGHDFRLKSTSDSVGAGMPLTIGVGE